MSPREIAAFAGAALRYWLSVFPRTSRELRRVRRRAAQIADPALRRSALESLEKRANIEGAAAFAAAVPGSRRGSVVRALVAFQAAYNYVDLLAEQPSADPVGRARRLHEALLVALDPGAAHRDYHADGPAHGDEGYLVELVDACRDALEELPSHRVIAMPARRMAARIVEFQSLSVGEPRTLECWALAQQPTARALQWWEIAAGAGSSLGVHALIAAAASPSLCAEDLDSLERAYFPWIGALHSLLDSLVDEGEDAASAQLSLVGCYASRGDAEARMGVLGARALVEARAVPAGSRHAVLVAAMASSYLSAPEASLLAAQPIARSVREAIGAIAAPALLVFRVRHLLGGLHRHAGGVIATERNSASVGLRAGERGADAGAA